MSCRKAFPASDTSDGWPIGNAKQCWNSVANCWARSRPQNPNPIPTKRHWNHVRSVGDRCVWSNVQQRLNLPPSNGGRCRFSIVRNSGCWTAITLRDQSDRWAEVCLCTEIMSIPTRSRCPRCFTFGHSTAVLADNLASTPQPVLHPGSNPSIENP